MEIKTAQQEVRSVFVNGSFGQAVSGVIWLVSAALATFVSTRSGIIVLVFGGMFIFPLTQLAIRLSGRKPHLSGENPFNQLAMQTAFIIPLSLPVIGAATLYNLNWFYPAFMIIVGTHYMPFMTLYGIWQYGILAAILIFSGIFLGLYFDSFFVTGGWLTGVILVMFSFYLGLIYKKGSGTK